MNKDTLQIEEYLVVTIFDVYFFKDKGAFY